jgi:hypothetical protein
MAEPKAQSTEQHIQSVDTNQPRAINNAYPVFAFARALGTVKRRKPSRWRKLCAMRAKPWTRIITQKKATDSRSAKIRSTQFVARSISLIVTGTAQDDSTSQRLEESGVSVESCQEINSLKRVG